MSAVLRAYGNDFDVDTFLIGCALPICAIKRRGEPVFPATQPKGRQHDCSAVHVSVSDAGFDEFQRQTVEAAAFLMAQFDQVRRLVEWPGVSGVTLDFSVNRRDVMVQCEVLPLELVSVAGSLRLSIELSQYQLSERYKGAGRSLV